MSTVALTWRGLAPRWAGSTAVIASVFVFVLVGIWMAQSMDASVYETLPAAMRTLVGIPDGADVETMAYAQMIAFLGEVSTAVYAVAVGGQLVAVEEQDRAPCRSSWRTRSRGQRSRCWWASSR